MSEQASAHGPRVVVGVDGEAPSRLALEWAAHEASLRGARLEVVYAMYFRRELLDVFADASTHEQAVLDAEVARARSLEPSLAVVGIAADPPATRALIDASEGADLLVVGSRGLGSFEEFALGSVSHQCSHRSPCPLVIVRPEGTEQISHPRGAHAS